MTVAKYEHLIKKPAGTVFEPKIEPEYRVLSQCEFILNWKDEQWVGRLNEESFEMELPQVLQKEMNSFWLTSATLSVWNAVFMG